MNVPWKYRSGATASNGGVTAIEFDPDLELLWLCDSFGMLMSFTVQSHGDSQVWSTYSSFSATHRAASGIFFLKADHEKLVTVADRDVIRGFKRGGVPALYLTLPENTQSYMDLFQADAKTNTMFFTGNIGITRLQLHDGVTEPHTVPVDDFSIVSFRQSDAWVATGSSSGTVTIRDSRELAVVGSVTPSRNRVMAMDIYDNTVLAVFSERSTTSFVKVYDVRKLGEPVNTIQNIRSGNISHIRRYQDSFGLSHDRAFLLTPQGFTIVQMDQDQPVFCSSTLSEGQCTAVAVSPSNMCAAVGNDKGYFFALAHPVTRDDYVISTFVQPVRPKAPTFEQSWVEASVGHGFDETASPTELASNWPESDYMILTKPQRLRCVAAESNSVLHNQWNLIRADCYLPDPKDVFGSAVPNPYPFNTQLSTDPLQAREVLLALRKDRKRTNRASRCGDTGEYAVMEDALHGCYSLQRRMDWASYNEIPHKVIGLDNSFPECWISSLLESLYLCQPPEFPIRRIILRHLCRREFCMTCELSFVFANMLLTATSSLGLKDAALSPIVQMGNVVRTMHQIRAFTQSHVFERARSRDEAVAKMHLAVRLVLETLHKDLLDQTGYPFPGYPSPSFHYENSIAAHFGTEFSSNGRVHVEPRFFWDVPASALKVDEGLQHLLKQLEAYKDQVQIKSLPPIIVLLLNPEHGNLKPPTSLKISRAGKEDYNYVLNSHIIHLADDVDDAGNFVSHQRIKDDTFALVNDYRVTAPMKIAELERFIPALRSHATVVAFYALDSLRAPEYTRVGNTLHMNTITSGNNNNNNNNTNNSGVGGTNNNSNSNSNSMAGLGNANNSNNMNNAMTTTSNGVNIHTGSSNNNSTNSSGGGGGAAGTATNAEELNRPLNMWHILGPLLTHDIFAKPIMRDPERQRFRSPLSAYTDIQPGHLVAIDAEYVVLKWSAKEGEVELPYPYTKKAHMGLARVSCVWSTEEGDERTIVDDYVHIPEEIEDYVTQFSGIHPGDLDPLRSTRNLTALKATYLKLRALVDAGVIFVGHGLAQDFRVCNIAVPKRQIIDTLEIYHKPGSRYLSLRFLAYHVLRESVQENEHDSIEDARTSLRLYRRYVRMQKEGTFESMLDNLMARGAETSWYVPDNRGSFGDTPMTPPVSMMGSPVFPEAASAGETTTTTTAAAATTATITTTAGAATMSRDTSLSMCVPNNSSSTTTNRTASAASTAIHTADAGADTTKPSVTGIIAGGGGLHSESGGCPTETESAEPPPAATTTTTRCADEWRPPRRPPLPPATHSRVLSSAAEEGSVGGTTPTTPAEVSKSGNRMSVTALTSGAHGGNSALTGQESHHMTSEMNTPMSCAADGPAVETARLTLREGTPTTKIASESDT